MASPVTEAKGDTVERQQQLLAGLAGDGGFAGDGGEGGRGEEAAAAAGEPRRRRRRRGTRWRGSSSSWRDGAQAAAAVRPPRRPHLCLRLVNVVRRRQAGAAAGGSVAPRTRAPKCPRRQRQWAHPAALLAIPPLSTTASEGEG
uniref:Uncharacterized protein n=1 Tax=Oryza glumipatula TaxID=40148 RepID=A0A0E0A0B9_9ORYZ